MSYFLLHFAMADPVIDQEKKSYRWIWVPVNDAGEMRFFILSRMYPVSFKFDFWWIWKLIETFFLPSFPFYIGILMHKIYCIKEVQNVDQGFQIAIFNDHFFKKELNVIL